MIVAANGGSGAGSKIFPMSLGSHKEARGACHEARFVDRAAFQPSAVVPLRVFPRVTSAGSEAIMSTSSRWRFGCGVKFTVYVPRGYDYKPREVECGSTAYDGGVNQCSTCAANLARDPGPIPEYGDDIPEGDETPEPDRSPWVICTLCRGEGTHVNPSIDAHGISAEEMHDDPDFAESYMRGDYDVPCARCGGSGKVREAELGRIHAEERERVDERRERALEDGDAEAYYSAGDPRW